MKPPRALYLHFLSGQLGPLLGRNPPANDVERGLKLLTVATHVPLYCPVSALWESRSLTVRTLQLSRMLLDREILRTMGYTGSTEEFLESRVELYQHEREHYPTYFNPTSPKTRLLRAITTTDRTGSNTTLALERSLSQWAQPHLFPRNNYQGSLEAKLAPVVVRALHDREGQALTYDYFKTYVDAADIPSASAEDRLRRQIHLSYVQHYMAQEDADIPTGMPVLDYLDSELTLDFPLYDLKLLHVVVRSLGLGPFIDNPWSRHETFWEFVTAQRGWDVQFRLSHLVRLLLWGLALTDAGESALGTLAARRHRIEQRVRGVLPEYRVPHERDPNTALNAAHNGIELALRQLKVTHPAIAALLKRAEDIDQLLNCDVLLVTATDLETRTVLATVPKDLSRTPARVFIGDKTYFDLGLIAGARVVLVQTDMGPGGPGGASLTLAEALSVWEATSVILVGIAFGVDPARQRLGDVVVAQQVLDYEAVRVGVSPEGGYQLVPRGDRPRASVRLLDRCHAALIDWPNVPVHFGLLLTGAKLVDHKDFRDQLVSLSGGEAIGGDMEAGGVYAAAVRARRDWVAVKAISDWADGRKHRKETSRQELAANNAAAFVAHLLRAGGLGSRYLIKGNRL